MNLADIAITLLWSAIMFFAGAEAILMGRTFAVPDYRSRAYWMATLLIVLPAYDVASFFNRGFTNETVNTVNYIFGLAFFIIVYIFVDKNLTVMMQLDFFHRDTARWTGFRRIGFVLLFAYLAITVATLPESKEYGLAIMIGNLVVIAITIGWESVALVMAARRTPDQTMRNFAKLVGIGLAFGAAAAYNSVLLNAMGLGWFTASGLDVDILLVFAAYILYRAVLSLSRVGRIEKIEQ